MSTIRDHTSPPPPESMELSDLEAGHPPTRTGNPSTSDRMTWHPRLTPYRLLSLLLPASLGTAKAVVSQQGQQNEPITLEWISGVVVFIVLFNTGTYERKPLQHVPRYLVWLFKYDCMDAVWWLLPKLFRGFSRPSYLSDEVDVEEHGTIYLVTSYRLLVCAMVVTLGLAKAGLTYGNVSVGATWVEWILGVFISSLLYIIGLYESNTVGLYSSFFGTDRAYVLDNGLFTSVKLFFLLTSLFMMSAWFIFPPSSRYHMLATPEQIEQMPVVLRAFNQSAIILLNGTSAGSFLIGAVAFVVVFPFVFDGMNVHSRLPLRLRVLLRWIPSFSSFILIPTTRPPTALISLLASTPASLGRLIFSLRYPLTFIFSVFFIFLSAGFFSGYIYHIAAGDMVLQNVNGEPPGVALLAVVYVLLTLLGMLFIFIAGLVLLWSARNMRGEMGRVWVGGWKPALRIRVQSVLKRMGQLRRRLRIWANDAAVRVLTSLTGLDRSEEVHHAFLEFSQMLHAGDDSGSR